MWMGKIKLFLKRKEIASMGIGAMIVFIAMVLVAGIAASVFIQVANQLQMQALFTGEETIDEVATGIAVMDIEGNASNPANGIDKLTITVKGRAGSGDIDLDELVIEIADNETKSILIYDSNNYVGTIPSDVFAAVNSSSLTATEFGVIVLEDADGSCQSTTPIINKGDYVMLTIDTGDVFSPGIAERTDIWGNVIPEIGSWGIISFRTPASYTDTVYDLM
jgi:flagellin FlaB